MLPIVPRLLGNKLFGLCIFSVLYWISLYNCCENYFIVCHILVALMYTRKLIGDIFCVSVYLLFIKFVTAMLVC